MYQIREVTLNNKHMERKRLIIEFADPAQAIVGEFLMTDASLLNFSILEDLNKVISGESNDLESSGNRCFLKITPHKTYIEDLYEGLYADFDTFPAYEMDTVELRDLVVMWKRKIAKLHE